MHELRNKSKADLQAQLKELKTELAALRVAKVTGGAPNKLSKIKVVRLGIAQILTVISQNQRTALKEAYSGKVRRGPPPRRPAPRPPPRYAPVLTPRRAAAPGKSQKHLPLDLREKKTRAIRRALTAEQKAMVTVKEKKRQQNFPRRKYAVKA